jgi:hypothetical protein
MLSSVCLKTSCSYQSYIFLAHAFPLEYNHQGYIDVIDEIIPEIAKHELALY